MARNVEVDQVYDSRMSGLKSARNGTSSAHKRKSTSSVSRSGQSISLSQSLIQALHSADLKLLEDCLKTGDANIIRATVRRIPRSLVLPLLEQLVTRLSRRRQGAAAGGVDSNRGFELLEWIRQLLIVHIAYLTTMPALSSQLGSLTATLQARTAYHDQLLALNGRLDLVAAQISERGHVAPGRATKGLTRDRDAGKASTYMEGDSSEESETDDIEVGTDGPIQDILVEEEGSDEGMDDQGDLGTDASPGPASLPRQDRGHNNGVLSRRERKALKSDKSPDVRDPSATGLKPATLFDLEAQESDDDSDVEGQMRQSIGRPFADSEEDGDEDGEDLDKYESDFIDDEDEDETDDEEEGDGASGSGESQSEQEG